MTTPFPCRHDDVLIGRHRSTFAPSSTLSGWRDLRMAQPHQVLAQFWQQQAIDIHAVDPDRTDFKTHELPLARIKKIMKADEEVDPSGHRFMISAEAPVVFAKACEIFILELTIRAWALTEENKRRTLQRNDISSAIARCDMYDFLIDIVPREEVKQKKMDGSAMHMMDPSHFLFFQQQAPAQALQMQQMFWQQQLAAQQLMMQMQQQQQQQAAQQQRQHMGPLHQHGMGDNRDGLGLGHGAGDQLDADASDEDDSDDDDDDQDGDDVS